MRNLLARAFNRLAGEDGISLVMALGILGVLSVAGAAVVFYAGSNARTAEYSNADNAAFSLAEAGVAEGLSVINEASNPGDPSLLSSPTTVSLESGDVTYSGTTSFDGDGHTIWTINATGTVDNPTGPSAADVQRTLNQRVLVRGLVTGADPALWDRLFHNRTDKCLTIDTVDVISSVTSRGDICLRNGAKILRATTNNTTTVRAGDDIFLGNPPATFIGDNNAPGRVQRVEVGGNCKFGNSPGSTPCGETDNVFTEAFSATPENLTKPQVDFQYWYENAKPGPNHNCTTGTFPGGFDNDGVLNGSRSTEEITPKYSSYSCRYVEDGETVGEISWNHNTHILTISGTIFIDGDIRFDDDNEIVNYQGRATIYAGDDLEFDEIVCAGGDGTKNCRNDPTDWDPEQNMMILISNGWSEYDQGSSLSPAAFQGVVYAKDFCLVHQDIYVSGPMICDEIRIEENDENGAGGWPSFFSWPSLQSLIPGVLYGDTSTAADYEIELLEQTG